MESWTVRKYDQRDESESWWMKTVPLVVILAVQAPIRAESESAVPVWDAVGSGTTVQPASRERQERMMMVLRTEANLKHVHKDRRAAAQVPFAE